MPGSGYSIVMDAITLLRNDHKTVEQLFKRFEKAGDRAHVEKRQIVDRIIEELSVHAVDRGAGLLPGGPGDGAGHRGHRAREPRGAPHRQVGAVRARRPRPDDERFDAKVTVLIENVRHHVEEEESEFFPKVRDELGRKALAELGDAMAEAKKSAPTHPHPRSPDAPPGNSVVGAIAGVVDRVGDNISGIAQGGVSAAQDFIARVLGKDARVASPTGSSAARSRARVRALGGLGGEEGRRTDGQRRCIGRLQNVEGRVRRREGDGDDHPEIGPRHRLHRQASGNEHRPYGRMRQHGRQRSRRGASRPRTSRPRSGLWRSLQRRRARPHEHRPPSAPLPAPRNRRQLRSDEESVK